ncbi:MAG: hypothetical protein K6F00_04560 [Lachnospiraceae bacterium]|nr:hypothetical protein [Lachnospiraceae bacterium]
MLFTYLGISGFLGIFTIIYYRFSHGVTSPYMTFAFLIPLLLGGISVLIKKRFGDGNAVSQNLFPSGVAALIAASILQAVFDIAGNSSVYVKPLFWAGIIMLATAAGAYVVNVYRRSCAADQGVL